MRPVSNVPAAFDGLQRTYLGVRPVRLANRIVAGDVAAGWLSVMLTVEASRPSPMHRRIRRIRCFVLGAIA
ncbi:hypothetical protein BAB79_06710 [Mycobacteroides abscessus]|nr:hypothetical protein A3O06_06715 [Mycobacteroides abscessus]ANO23320.1 hypothetical protein BAB79_06710 [Mycobacteroides abscessus]